MNFTQGFSKQPACVLVIGAILLTGAIAGLLWYRLSRRRGGRGTTRKTDVPPEANPSTTAEVLPLNNSITQLETAVIESREDSASSHTLGRIAANVASTDIKEFMDGIVARIRETGPMPETDPSITFIEEIVDRMDDLALIKRRANSDDLNKIDQFAATLTEMLKTGGIELLQSANWNPEIQRALSKTPRAGILEPTIESYGSTGFTRHSQLIRKQEVMLVIPQLN